MPRTIIGRELTTVDIAPDGSFIRLNLTDEEDRAATVELPVECGNQLIMTLPHVINKALRIRYCDSSFRLVFPLGEWQLERAAPAGQLVLTLGTVDGFEVAFSVEDVELERMQETVSNTDPIPLKIN